MTNKVITNKVLEKLPKHLRSFILKQDYEGYTAQNQAVWRYVMKKHNIFSEDRS